MKLWHKNLFENCKIGRKRKKTPVTLIVGAICKDAVVLGAESETTCGDAKLHGTQKLTIINFLNGNVIVGEAGVQFLSNAVVDRFSDLAKKIKITDRESVAKTLAESFREISKASMVTNRKNLIMNPSP